MMGLEMRGDQQVEEHLEVKGEGNCNSYLLLFVMIAFYTPSNPKGRSLQNDPATTTEYYNTGTTKVTRSNENWVFRRIIKREKKQKNTHEKYRK